jgi:transcriptional regulator with XRE-family HTH domain/tetratricopeptide (TPR) repeat protein
VAMGNKNDEKNELVSFGAWLRQRRRALDLTQAALANHIGCAAITIKKIEQDERRPSQQMAQLLADYLAIPPAARDDFMRMARGQFVPSMTSPEEPIRPPSFLQRADQTAKPDQSQFVARKRELALLNVHLEAAVAGNGHTAFIVGEAGQGKTTLMAEFARQAQESHPDLVVAGGNCSAQLGIGDAYLPFRDILSMLTGDLETRWLAGSLLREQVLRLWSLFPYTVQTIVDFAPDLIDTLVPGAPLLRRIGAAMPDRVDWLAEVHRLIERQRERQRVEARKLEEGLLLEEVTQTVQALAAQRPLLLVLDDLQWIDDASKSLLFHAGRRLAGSRILLLGAYRSSEAGLGHVADDLHQTSQQLLGPVIGELKRQFGDIELDLDQQGAAEKRAFIEALLDSEPNRLTESFRESLFLHTQGHPLFAVEMLRNMQANGALVRNEAGQWVENTISFPQKLPARVEAVIEQRIDRLDRTLQDILTVASVEGESFTAQVAAHVLGLDEPLLLRHLSRDLEQDHHLVQEEGQVTVSGQILNRYRFGHVLFQEYLDTRLSQGERRLYHRQVAESLEAIFDADTHGAATLLHNSDRVAEVLDSAYPDWLIEFGPSLLHHFWHSQDWAKAACYALCVGAEATRVYALRDAIAAFDYAIKALDNLPDPPFELVFEAIIRWQEAAFKFRPYAEQLHQLARAEKIARNHNDKARLIQALHWTANVHLARGLWMRAGPALTECLALAEELGNERLSVGPTYFKALMTSLSNPRRALDLLGRSLELARRYGDRSVEVVALSTTAQMHAQLGEFGPAKDAMQQAYRALQGTDSPLTESDADLLAAWTYLAMGDTQRGLEYGQRSVDRAIATDNMDCICYGYDCVGYGNLAMQRVDEAASAFAEAIKRSEMTGAIIPRLLGQAGLAMSQFQNGRVEAIADMETTLATMQTYDDHVGAADVARTLGECLSTLGELDRAEDYLNSALDFFRRMEMRPYIVRTLFALAELFTRQSRPAAAQSAQTEAETLMAALSREGTSSPSPAS